MLEVFNFNGHDIRGYIVEDIPWFVAKDVASLLEYGNTNKAVIDHCKQAQSLGELVRGNDSLPLQPQTKLIQHVDVVRLIVRSNMEQAIEFEEWAMDVLVTVIRTGKYISPHAKNVIDLDTVSDEELSALGMQASQRILDRKREAIAALEPKAEFYDQIGSSRTNLSVREAAKALGTGERRLFTYLRQIKWVQKISNEPYQAKIEAGYLATKISRWTDEKTGEGHHRLVTLVTGKGLQKLKRMLNGGSELLELPAA